MPTTATNRHMYMYGEIERPPSVVLEKTRGFTAHEVREIGRIVARHASELLEAWDAVFDESE